MSFALLLGHVVKVLQKYANKSSDGIEKIPVSSKKPQVLSLLVWLLIVPGTHKVLGVTSIRRNTHTTVACTVTSSKQLHQQLKWCTTVLVLPVPVSKTPIVASTVNSSTYLNWYYCTIPMTMNYSYSNMPRCWYYFSSDGTKYSGTVFGNEYFVITRGKIPSVPREQYLKRTMARVFLILPSACEVMTVVHLWHSCVPGVQLTPVI